MCRVIEVERLEGRIVGRVESLIKLVDDGLLFEDIDIQKSGIISEE